MQDLSRAFTAMATSARSSQSETHWLHIDRAPPEIAGVPGVVIGITADANGMTLSFKQPKASDKVSGLMWFDCNANAGTVLQ